MDPIPNLTLEQVYNPVFAHLYGILLNVTLTIDIVFLIPIIYIVLKKSPKEMTVTKYYFISNFIINLIFDIYISTLKPIFLFPLPMIFPMGITRLSSIKFELVVTMFLGSSMVAVVAFQAIYRASYILPWDWVTDLFSKVPHVFILYAFAYGLVYFPSNILLLILGGVEEEKFK